MIDLGLAKLALIGAVALVVIGPEKLPKVARMAGSLLGRAQRYLNDVKAEVSREIELDELRKMQADVETAASEFKSSVAKEMTDVEHGVNSIWDGDQVSAKQSLQAIPEEANIARKAREFRRKKLLRNSALPAWYKQQQGSKTRILSASARVAKYRPGSKSTQSFYS
ncbi:Sec-independent protein translocase protein TatB [Solimicrobium silvestre]|uniref:Sec-independent protein translocase protein TatB n=1 Tax=Solimicrobium silvestre TaxID=2099400 RepID=A0A2S9H209_9BURK|nr:Sec-independent protein translocase protein TatB [Solimicrobium silvestre]PRC93997.1 tatB: twin arginine-targeting protein translocase TatB [Solimicrobium silvestre]